MKRSVLITMVLTLFLTLMVPASHAVTVYVGDVDGFGFGGAPGYNGAHGGPADRDGNGLLENGDVLPDLDGDGGVWDPNDIFDNRSSAETSDSKGAQWTDVALAWHYKKRPGDADDAFFVFSFAVPSPEDPDYGQDHFVSFVYGDYDVDPMYAVVEDMNVPLIGVHDVGLDGYIWQAYAPVSWSHMQDGEVTIDVVAPREPYVTFDYALLHTNPTLHAPVPEAVWLLSMGLIGLVGFRRKFHK